MVEDKGAAAKSTLYFRYRSPRYIAGEIRGGGKRDTTRGECGLELKPTRAGG